MLSDEDKQTLLEIARASVKNGLEHGHPLTVNPDDYAEHLRVLKATFVTLTIRDRLRGCIGTLEARQPLVADVAEHAYAAAFRDPRFSPLSEDEYADLQYHISILGETTPMQFKDEQDLLSQIRPGIDGLVLSEGLHKGTFLPSVWDSLPTPALFLRHLKQKAGLPTDHWSDSLKVERYTVEEF